MVATPLRWTTRDLDALPDDGGWKRYEIMDGELSVTRSPHIRHQGSAGNIHFELEAWSRKTGLGKPFQVPGVIFSPTDAVIPDVFRNIGSSTGGSKPLKSTAAAIPTSNLPPLSSATTPSPLPSYRGLLPNLLSFSKRIGLCRHRPAPRTIAAVSSSSGKVDETMGLSPLNSTDS
jgi:hypothetical protein